LKNIKNNSIMPPHTVFIVPYRDREAHKKRFEIYIDSVLKYNGWVENVDVEIFFTHQCDNRSFNRGGMKNMGLLLLKQKYPTTYKNITIVFHDVDSIPESPSLIPYKTTNGTVSHYYGFTFVLGGILAIKAVDFERVNGFPCFWGWGLEDNALYNRCVNAGIKVDRSIFFTSTDKRISREGELPTRQWSRSEGYQYRHSTKNGYSTIKNVKYTINNRMMNITSFTTDSEYIPGDLVSSGGRTLCNLPVIHPCKNIFSSIKSASIHKK